LSLASSLVSSFLSAISCSLLFSASLADTTTSSSEDSQPRTRSPTQQNIKRDYCAADPPTIIWFCRAITCSTRYRIQVAKIAFESTS
jgi:hypothetical protein